MASALVIGVFVALVPSFTNASSPAVAAQSDIAIPAVTGELPGYFQGKTGESVVAWIDHVQKVSSDGGATWQDAPTQEYLRAITGGYAYTQKEGTTTAHPLAGGPAIEWDSWISSLELAWGTRVVVANENGNKVIDLSPDPPVLVGGVGVA